MISTPCGRVSAFALAAPSLRGELALGMDLTLESSRREIEQVRAILRGAIAGLAAEFGVRAVREAVVAMQFQDLSDQLLASAARRIDRVRLALGQKPADDLETKPASAPTTGEAEFFQEQK